jgi:hypothetical protein
LSIWACYLFPLIANDFFFEFIQAIRRQVWIHEADRTERYSEREADQMIADWESDVVAGVDVLMANDSDAVLRMPL